MQTVEPDPQQFLEATAGLPAGTPVTMLNLLRFRDVATYADGPADCSGREAYFTRYGAESIKHVKAAGGEVVWAGEARGSLIAPPGEEWDAVLLVRYPSIEAFLGMTQDPAYLECAVHRTAALADSRLIATVEG
jgi:uncharacterized protein (DUF1330 family)